MHFKFSLRTTLICGFLATLMLYASYWQYTRYVSKLGYIERLDSRLSLPVEPLSALLSDKQISSSELIHRRVSLRGVWDYQHEIVLRNRKLGSIAGVHVITPFLIDGYADKRLLISRGFIPLSAAAREQRSKFQNGPLENFVVLIKESEKPKFLAPKDPDSGASMPWVDAWLRIDPAAIGKQLPYPVLPFYAEMMSRDINEIDSNKLLQHKSERDQILFLPGAGARLSSLKNDQESTEYPVAVFDTIVPAGRHFSYIFEWAIMSVMVVIAAIILQLKRA